MELEIKFGGVVRVLERDIKTSKKSGNPYFKVRVQTMGSTFDVGFALTREQYDQLPGPGNVVQISGMLGADANGNPKFESVSKIQAVQSAKAA